MLLHLNRHVILAVFFLILTINFVASNKIVNQKMSFSFRGPVASVFTPFNNDEERSINYSVVPKYAEFLASKNVTGVLVAGTHGEGTSLTVDERKKLVETWVAAAKTTNQRVIVAVGGIALKNVKELSVHAEKIGAVALLILPDLYVKPSTTEEVIDYLQLVGEAAPKTPLLYYESPKFGVDIDIEKFLTTVGNKVPTFAGIKYVTYDKTNLQKAWVAGNKYNLFIGNDVVVLDGCIIGMNSMIISTATFIPELAFEILEFCQSKVNFAKAQEAQNSINNLVKTIDIYGDNTANMKAATTVITGLPLGPTRLPMKPLSQKDVQSMTSALSKLSLKVH